MSSANCTGKTRAMGTGVGRTAASVATGVMTMLLVVIVDVDDVGHGG